MHLVVFMLRFVIGNGQTQSRVDQYDAIRQLVSSFAEVRGYHRRTVDDGHDGRIALPHDVDLRRDPLYARERDSAHVHHHVRARRQVQTDQNIRHVHLRCLRRVQRRYHVPAPSVGTQVPCPPNEYGSVSSSTNERLPCDCVNGVCDEGREGTGECFCCGRWAGERCDESVRRTS